MYRAKTNSISTVDIAGYLNKTTEFGKNYTIHIPSSIDDLNENSIAFCDSISYEELSKISKKILILTESIDLEGKSRDSLVADIIITDNPERDFYLVVKEFFIEENLFLVDSSVEIDKSVKLGVNINIGANSSIGKNVVIGNNTYIGKNVIISDDVEIGTSCYIKDGSIIGSDSFKFIKEDKKSFYIPFFGKLIIGDDVWVGSKVVVERPSIGKAYINDGVKIDDLVQIGADSNIGQNTEIAAGSIVGREVDIGLDCMLGINSVIKPNIKIEDWVTTGIGAVVISNLKQNCVYVGNPARTLKK